jgi:Domain of unknown function (DUF1707)
MEVPPQLRASDAERERTVAHLRRHAADGRLTVEELDERCARALSAKTVAELAELLADLPPPAPPPVPSPPAPAVGGFGVRPFTYQWEHAVRPEQAQTEALRFIAPAMHRYGYELVERSPRRLVFVYGYRPAWTFALAVLAFPIGLAALIYKAQERVAIDFDRAPGGGTRLVISGRAPRRVRRAFAELVL